MMFSITPEQKACQDKADCFSKRWVMPFAEANDKTETLDPCVKRSLAEEGYLGAAITKEYGGLAYDNIMLGLLNEAVGKACASTRSLLTVHGMVSKAVEKWGNENQKKKYLPKMASGSIIGAFGASEANAGSDISGMEATAVKSGRKYTLNGEKTWTTMGQIAGLFLIFAKVEGLVSAFLVEKGLPGFEIEPVNGLLGSRASMLARLKFTNCEISEENLLGNTGAGLSHIAQTALDYGRYSIAWGCVGIARACLEHSSKYVKTRKQFKSFLFKHQLIQKLLTEMAVSLEASRLLCLKAGWLKDSGGYESVGYTLMAKYHAANMVNQVSKQAVQIHGARGLHDSYPIERLFRDAHINEIVEGTAQINEILISSNTIRRYGL